MGKTTNIVIGVIILILLVGGFFFIQNQQFSIAGLSSNYNIGDDIKFQLVAIGDTGLRGQDCVVKYDVIDRSRNFVVESNTLPMNLVVLGGIDAIEINVNTDQSGLFEVSASYDCQITFTGLGTLTGPQLLNENPQSFRIVEEIVVRDHDYQACGDTTGSKFDIYWYDSNGIRNDLVQDCGSDNICQATSSTSASCSGSQTLVDDETISKFSTQCFSGDVYYFDNFGNREEKKLECNDKQCINGECVSATFTEITGCEPGVVDSTSCVDNAFIKLTCNVDGISFSQEVLNCADSFTCDTSQGCIENIVVTLPDSMTAQEECSLSGGAYVNNKCLTSTTEIDQTVDDATQPPQNDVIKEKSFLVRVWEAILSFFRTIFFLN